MKKLRLLKRKFSIAAPQLAVRPQRPWYVRWGVGVPAVLLLGWLLWGAYTKGLEFSGFHFAQTEDELTTLKRQVASLRDENTKLNSQLVEVGRQMQIELAANSELAQQLKGLNDEKAHLDEDLEFYKNMTESGVHVDKLTIQRLKVTQDSLPGEYHCSLLLVQGGQRPKEFVGRLQFVVTGMQGSQKSVVVVPGPKSPEVDAYGLNFKYYQRVERSFRLPAGMSFDSVQVRVYERGSDEPKVKQDATLS
jgi:Family of unknown function (DUF6776)